jgi:putative ABC transport system permease protein
MDSLFGISLTSIMLSLIALVAIAFLLLALIAWRNPLLVRIGLRNVVRRKVQTALIVIGLMLSTLIISAAFATGDTVGFSVTNQIYETVREADIIVEFDDESAPTGIEALSDDDLQAIQSRFGDDPDVDGITGLLRLPVPAVNREARLSEPLAFLVGIVPATADAFNSLITPGGDIISAQALSGDDVYVTEELVSEIDLQVGGRVTIFFENEPRDLNVIGIVRDNALTALTAIEDGESAGGIVANLETVRAITGKSRELELIVLSTNGGVRNDLDVIDAFEARVESYLDTSAVPGQVAITKSELVGFAELIGSIFVTFFLLFGLFSIAAGIMLIFLTFVMLAAERRSEMGMARAVGMKRLHLTESFIAEGMAYNIGAALVGSLLGLGVAYLLIAFIARLFEEFGLTIAFHFGWQGFVVAYTLGVTLTFLTVAFASWRAANLNIVRAIRDIPEPQLLQSSDRSLGRLFKATLGVLWLLLWFVVVAIWIGVAIPLFAVVTSQVGKAVPDVLTGPIASLILLAVTGLLVLVLYGLTRLLGRVQRWAARHRNAGGWAVVMLALGVVLLFWGGWVIEQAFAYTSGTTVVVLALGMLAVYFGASQRAAFSTASLALLWYWLLPLPFSLFSDEAVGWNDPLNGVMSLVGLGHDRVSGDIEMFFVSGIAITTAATMFVIFNAPLFLGGVRSLSGVLGSIAPAVRTAVAYPLAAQFRTAMTLAMFGLVVFSLVVMATLNSNFTDLFLGEDASIGYEVRARGNPNNRIDDLRETLAEAGYDPSSTIAEVGTLTFTPARVSDLRESNPEASIFSVSGADDEFLRTTELVFPAIANGYDSEEAVYEALRSDASVAVISEFVLSSNQGDPFDDGGFELRADLSRLIDRPWEPIPLELRDPDTGALITVEVIAIIGGESSAILFELETLLVNERIVDSVFEGGEFESFFVTTVEGGDDAALQVARDIESTLLERGVEGESINQLIDDATRQNTQFQLLFEGFMSLGLVVGIAALGVIAFRTVAERRQQIGMLRAIGYSRRLVALSFFLESSFIAITGIVMGLFLGTALSYNLLTDPEAIGVPGAEIDFSLPWVRLALIVGVAYGASALMTLIPARSASRVPVAEALRYNG